MKKKTQDEVYICCVCGDECAETNIRHITIKGKIRKICKECATAIKGLS